MTTQPKWLRQVVADLDRHEGFRQYAYPDPLSKLAKAYPPSKYRWGYRPATEILKEIGETEVKGRPWTVGHGFTHRVTPESSLTKQTSTIRLRDEALSHAEELNGLIPGWQTKLPLYVQTVVVNMIFNMGRDRLSKFDTTLALINNGKYAEAGTNLRKSLWFKQTKSRAEELVKRLETGKIAPEHQVK
jgi:GH24 family phage-related lysozyme (muramidase)